MVAKYFLVLCASVFFVETISSQCLRGPYDAGIIGSGIIAEGIGLAPNGFGNGPMASNAIAYDALAAGYGPGLAYGNAAPASGRAFPVTCSSPIAPVGVSIASENAIEGILAVTGELPVLSAVALEGALPTVGSGSIIYGCGSGAVGIVSEGVDALAASGARLGYENALAAELGYGTQFGSGLGYGTQLAGGIGYGAPLSGGLGYRGLAGVGPVVSSGCGCGL